MWLDSLTIIRRQLHTVCAISCAMTRETQSLLDMDETTSSCSMDDSRYSTRPQFSMAPALKSGIATWSAAYTSNQISFNLPTPLTPTKYRLYNSIIIGITDVEICLDYFFFN